MRLFTALDIPSALRDQISSLPKAGLDFKSVSHPDDLHITLRFIGDVPDEKLEEIESCLDSLKKPARFSVEVGGLDVFVKKDQTVLYAPVLSARKPGLLADQVTERLARADLVFPPRDYVPHVTIARLRSTRNIDDYKKRHAPTIRAQWTVHGFHLMQSAHQAEGQARYSVLKTYDLSPY